jgi:hypothetical protein
MSDPLHGWNHLPGDSVALDFSAHAVERFGERLRPGLAEDQIRRQLWHMLATATVTREPPPWFSGDRTAVAYLTLGADDCMPLRDRQQGVLLASTLIVRGTISEEVRQRRNIRRATRTTGRRAGKKVRKYDKRPARPPSIDEAA